MSFRSLCFWIGLLGVYSLLFAVGLMASAEEPVDPRLPAVVPVSPSGYGIPVGPTFSFLQPIPPSTTSAQQEIDAALAPVLEMLPAPEPTAKNQEE